MSDHADIDEGQLQLALIVWNYLKLDMRPREKSDIILGLGSYDIRVAEKAASLWLQGLADTIVFSGNSGKLTDGLWTKPEAEVFRDRAIEMGVPSSNILTESKSGNSGENVRFTYDLLCKKEMLPKSIILVQKPYMERRAYATFMKQWPGLTSQLRISVTSPEIELIEYPSETTGNLHDVITVMIGDLARMKLYEEKGFQIHQDIPESVQKAYDSLKRTNRYSGHMPE